jgi:hypothetical protein
MLRMTKVRDASVGNVVIPAKAGIHCDLSVEKWIPAFAGMTGVLGEHLTISVMCVRDD